MTLNRCVNVALVSRWKGEKEGQLDAVSHGCKRIRIKELKTAAHAIVVIVLETFSRACPRSKTGDELLEDFHHE